MTPLFRPTLMPLSLRVIWLSLPLFRIISVTSAFFVVTLPSASTLVVFFWRTLSALRLMPLFTASASFLSAPMRAAFSAASASARALASLASAWFRAAKPLAILVLMVLNPSTIFWLTFSMTLSWALSAPMRAAVSSYRPFPSAVTFSPIFLSAFTTPASCTAASALLT